MNFAIAEGVVLMFEGLLTRRSGEEHMRAYVAMNVMHLKKSDSILNCTTVDEVLRIA